MIGAQVAARAAKPDPTCDSRRVKGLRYKVGIVELPQCIEEPSAFGQRTFRRHDENHSCHGFSFALFHESRQSELNRTDPKTHQ